MPEYLAEEDGTYHDLKTQIDDLDTLLTAIKAQTDKLTFDGSNNLKITF